MYTRGKGMQKIGSSAAVHDAVQKVTGASRYTDDIGISDLLHAKLLFSDQSHARILSIDSSEAESMEGVRAVLTCFNTTPRFYNSAKRFDEQEIPEDEQIFPRTVRHIGDRIAAVIADTREQASRALRKIQVEYEPLPAVFDPEEALRSGGDLYALPEVLVGGGDPEGAFARADFIFEDVRETSAVHHLALEPHSVIAECRDGLKATVWTSTQTTFAVRLLLSELFDLPRNRIRVIKPTMGGAFGAKIPMILEPVALAAAIMTGRPVKLTLSRKETFFATRTRHATKIRIKSGIMRDGTLAALDIEMILNAGAYCTQSINVGAAAVHDVVNCYRVPDIRARAVPVRTNLPVAGAMRGYGSPQIYLALQTHLAHAARELDIDFFAFQEKNLVRPDALHPVFGSPLGNPRPLDCLRKGAEIFDWEGKKKLPRKTADGHFHGVGIGIGTHANGVFGAHLDFTAIRLKLNEDDSIILYTGSHDMGNGSVTVQKMIVSEELRIPVERISAVESDTENCPYNLGDYASRGVFVSAEAARRAALSLRRALLEEASLLLGIPAGELELNEADVTASVPGGAGVSGVSRGELLRHIQQKRQIELEVTESWANAAGRTSYGAHIAEVSVDGHTGEVTLLSYAAVHDVGRVLNRLGIEGQLEGGIHMSSGYALSEELLFDDRGAMINTGLKSFRILPAGRMPRELSLAFIEEGEEPGPYGAKSIGECAAVPGAAAIANAVGDALGADILSIPLTPERIREIRRLHD
jgi:CO/xanthine dehydrogenase Mo-binding subunit